MKKKNRKEINSMTDKLNNSLIRTFEHVDKCEQEAYDRGLNDCWQMIKRLYLTKKSDSITTIERGEIFGKTSIYDILRDFTPQQALEKIRAWEEKKKTEERAKLNIGDVVEVYVNSSIIISKAVFLNDNEDTYCILYSPLSGPQLINKSVYTLKKTGKHVDILRFIEV